MAIPTNTQRTIRSALGNRAAATSLITEINDIEALSSTEAGYVDGVTAGTAAVGKAVVLTTGKTIDEINATTLKIGGTAVTATAAELNKTAGVTGGTVTASKALVVDANSRLDAVCVGTLSLGAAAGTAVTATAAEINKVAGVTGGTVAASKALVVDANSRLDAVCVGTLSLGAGAGTAVTASATELNKLAGATGTVLTSTGVGGTQIARQSADFSATSGDTGVTLTNLTGMVLTVVAGTYKFDIHLPCVATANSGIKAAFKLTTTVLTSIEASGYAFTATGVAVERSTTAADQTAYIGSTSAAINGRIVGTMVVGTGGTIQIQAAQNASHSDTTTVYAGSSFKLTRIA